MQEQQKIKSGDLTLEELVAKQNYLFRVTNYQRHYVWTEKEVKQFLSDGEFCWRQKAEGIRFIHFAGQISLRKIETGRDMRTRVEIVDGQQRLTTFILLVAIVCRKLSMEYRENFLSTMLWKKYFLSTAECADDEERLLLSRRDQVFWNGLTCQTGEVLKECESESHKHLKIAAKVIKEHTEQMAAEKTEKEAAQTLYEYVEAIAVSFRFVILTTYHDGYAYALYQIVNDRGVPLTSGELLKARTIELLSDKKYLALQAEQIWDDILKDTGEETNRCLNWHYVAITGRQMESKKSATIHEQYERVVFHCYNKRILSEAEQQEIKRQLDHLEVNVKRMRVLTQGMIPEAVSGYTKVLFEALIKVLKNTFCIPIYLKILEMPEKQAIKTLNSITPLLAKAFFMAKTMGGLHDGVIAKCYLEIWNYIDYSRADMDSIKEALERLVSRDNCRKEFISRAKDNVYVRGASRNDKAKFMLLMLELYYLKSVERGGNECGDDSVEFKVSEMSIEHILKESVDPNEISREFYSSLHKLGNLTLTGKRVNSRLKNADFEDKRERYQKSPYFITREVGKSEHWKKEDFNSRQEKFISDLEKIFEI